MGNTVGDGPRRPIGVTIIAVLLGIEGLFEVGLGILAIVGIFAIGHAAAVNGHTTTKTVIDIVGVVLGGSSLIIGIITLIFALGLWLLQRWAFWLTIIIEVITLLRHAFEFTQAHAAVGPIVASIILPVIILLYFLLDPYVRRAFRV